MAKPTLSMKPTGWFQVAWSSEVGVGDVHRMRYFGREMVAWRAQSGRLTVLDAYCEHLGAHLGYGGHVEGEVIQCPFHGWQWNHEGRNVCIPYQDRPNRGRRIRTHPVVERNESVYIWHDIEGREPYFDVPDIFASFSDGSSAADYYPQMTLYRDNRNIPAITPVDDNTSDVRFTVYIGRTGDDSAKAAGKAQAFGQGVIDQFLADVHIWSHQRYSDPPALTTDENKGFTALRKWANQFYPEP